jgi:hypothetical protein
MMALDKRVEVLFDEKEYRRLEEAARVRGQSVGSMVREAVAQYVAGPSEDEKRKAIDWMALQEGPVGSPEEIKTVIEDAKYEAILKSLETD